MLVNWSNLRMRGTAAAREVMLLLDISADQDLVDVGVLCKTIISSEVTRTKCCFSSTIEGEIECFKRMTLSPQSGRRLAGSISSFWEDRKVQSFWEMTTCAEHEDSSHSIIVA